MQKKKSFNWKLLALGSTLCLTVAFATALTSCSNPTGSNTGNNNNTDNNTPGVCTVRFYDGGTEYTSYYNIVKNTTIKRPNDNPTQIGDNRFRGWFKENGKDGNWGDEWDFNNDCVNDNLELYARWQKQFTATFITGKIGEDATKDVKVWEGEVIGAVKAPEPGALDKFKYWVDEVKPDTELNLDTTPVMKDMRLRPYWEFTLGQTGPSGGKIFYYDSDGFDLYIGTSDEKITAYYLEAAPNDYTDNGTAEFKWQDPVSISVPKTSSLNAEKVGQGRRNTALILAEMVKENKSMEDAPAAFNAFNYDGSGTWFLPSMEEYKALNSQKSAVGAIGIYWSSNEYSFNVANANTFNMDSNSPSTGVGKTTSSHKVRPIRAW
ncbi:MAG: hypothetical protein FWD91_05925 [Treponema sp.]|nr:hypothetical protein [Treponema sp.]